MGVEGQARGSKPRALYVCYFGIEESLVQTQVLPYLVELAASDVYVALLTFEPDMTKRWPAPAVAERREALAALGITWSLLPYHRRPLLAATAWDIFRGSRVARDIVRRNNINVVHGRSHVGAAIAEFARRRTAARLIFDIRGLLAEEYVEKGRWRAGGFIYRTVKRAEAALIRAADGFVVLTDAVRPAVLPAQVLGGRPVAVVPCCVGAGRFDRAGDRDAVRASLGASERRIFVHAGTIGGAYLTDEMAAFLAAARVRDRRTFALVLTRDNATPLVSALEARGFSAEDYRVVRADPRDVPTYLRASDIGLLMLRQAPARIGASPTKFAEYLAAGLPVVVTSGTGDLDVQLDEHRVGVRLTGFDARAYASALDELALLECDSDRTRRARDLVASAYDIRTIGGVRYRRLYDDVLRARRPAEGEGPA